MPHCRAGGDLRPGSPNPGTSRFSFWAAALKAPKTEDHSPVSGTVEEPGIPDIQDTFPSSKPLRAWILL